MNITIYKTTNCAWCPQVMKYLDHKGVKYDVVNLDDDPKLRQEIITRTNMMTVPVTVRGDWEDFVVGYQVGKLAQLIK